MGYQLMLAGLALLGFGALGESAKHAGAPPDVPIGTQIQALEFKDIRSLSRSLRDLGQHTGYLFVFTNTTCPLVRRYLPRLASLHESYGEHVQFVAVNVGPEDSIGAMASFALEFEIPFPIVKDAGGECVAALGVRRTPEVVLLDGEHKLVYRGRIDDQYRLGGVLPNPRRKDLELALQSLIAGEVVEVPETTVDGCQISASQATVRAPGSVTYHRDVAPLMEKHCVRCHQPSSAAPFSLLSYKQVRREGEMIAEVVGDGRMPPWNASPDHGVFQNDPAMSAEERARLVHWVEDGMPEGASPVQPRPIPAPAPEWQMGEPDLVISMTESHDIPAEGYVPYRYVVLPHLFLRETWIEALELRPDNRRVVHHANLGFAGPGHTPGPSTFITGYVPGGAPLDLGHFGQDLALRIPGRSVLGLQIHYVSTGKPETSKLSVGLRFKRDVVRKELHYNLTDPHNFKIAPGASAHLVKSGFRLQEDAVVLGFFAHMHLRGKDITFRAILPDGSSRTLLEIPTYNFDWQQSYEVAPGTCRLPKGTRVVARAHFDNSAFNPYNPDPTAEVGFGLRTVDEMMNAYVGFLHEGEDLGIRIEGERGLAARSGTRKPEPAK